MGHLGFEGVGETGEGGGFVVGDCGEGLRLGSDRGLEVLEVVAGLGEFMGWEVEVDLRETEIEDGWRRVLGGAEGE